MQGSTLAVPNDPHEIHVCLDNGAVGGIELLQRVPKEAIVRVRWLSAIASVGVGSRRLKPQRPQRSTEDCKSDAFSVHLCGLCGFDVF